VKEIGQATSIGPCRLIRTAADITAPRIRLRVPKRGGPAISEFSRIPRLEEPPWLTRISY